VSDVSRDFAALSVADQRVAEQLIGRLPIEVRSALFLESQRRLMVTLAAGEPYIGPLAPGHRMARKWTFTAKRWEPISFLFRLGDEVVVSSVHATREGRGYFRELLAGIERASLRVVVPSPLAHMTDILVHYGFVPRDERVGEQGSVDVWRRP